DSGAAPLRWQVPSGRAGRGEGSGAASRASITLAARTSNVKSGRRLAATLMLRRRSLERRLFGWLLAFALAPALLVLALATWLWTGSLDRVSTLGPWTTIAESGRIVLDAAQNAAARDSALAAALEQH